MELTIEALDTEIDLKVLSYWNLNREDVKSWFIATVLLKVLSYWNLNEVEEKHFSKQGDT